MSILLDFIYIVALALLKVIGRFNPRFAGGLKGRMRRRDVEHEPPVASAGSILVHAVSVGEVNLLRAFIADLEAMFPAHEIIISASTATGRDVAEKNFPTRRIVPWPLDLSYHVRPFLNRLKVKLVLLLELEVWPNFVLLSSRKRIPVVVINGRLTAESFKRYGLFRFFFKSVFRKLGLVFVQNEEYRERFEKLGCPADRIFLSGTMKYDLVPTGNDPGREASVRRSLHLGRAEPVLLGGSTHPGEEADVLDGWFALKDEY
ncbi:MAG: 3-deoxy-D-manno-octulosonic acid transferase, partial [Planctomycetota bacterium]